VSIEADAGTNQRALTVSTVIPTWNRKHALSAAIESVLAQTHPVDEMIIVDDGSTDGTWDFLKTLPENVGPTRILTIRQENAGVSAARNRGIRLASGELVAFLDDDDIWLPGKIARQLEVFARHPELSLLACSSDTLCLPGRTGFRIVGERGMLVRNRFLTPCVVARRSAILACGGFPEDMHRCEDYALWLGIAVRYKCAFQNEVLVRCGHGKPAFGHSGLSASLAALHDGEKEVLRRWRRSRNAGIVVFALARLLADLRHLRRIVAVWLDNN
jgi:glycosyltransferase involved in cell wall biosynthesis